MTAMPDWSTRRGHGSWDMKPRRNPRHVRLKVVPDPAPDPAAWAGFVDPAKLQRLVVVMEALRRIGKVLTTCDGGINGFSPLPPRVAGLAFDAIRQADVPTVELLPAVTPSYRGDLHLDWSLPTCIIELQVTPDGERHVLIETRDGGLVHEGRFEGDGVRMMRKELEAAYFA